MMSAGSVVRRSLQALLGVARQHAPRLQPPGCRRIEGVGTAPFFAAASPHTRWLSAMAKQSRQLHAELSPSRPSVVRRIARGLGLLFGIPLVAGAAYVASDENLRRTTIFWYNVFPIYARYRVVEAAVAGKDDAAQDAAFDELHDTYAPEMLRIILLMKGFYVKVGQIGSSRPDFVPKQYIRVLESLQDSTPPESFEYVKEVVEGSLGKPLSELFAFFDEKPLGAASIGQVHRARLHDGTDVVVKVKFPSVEALFDGDMQTITDFCAIAQPEQVPFLKEIRKQFMTEFDYHNEAQNLLCVHKNMQPFKREIEVPFPIMHLCSRDVLVMTYLPGVKLVDGIKESMRKVAAAKGTTLEEMEAERQRKIEAGILERGPSSLQMEVYRALAAVKALIRNIPIAVYNGTVGWFAPPAKYHAADPPLNIAHIVELLVRIHGHQIFVNGFFNGDPHPGNILLLDNGKIGLIDYGQVKQLNAEQRALLAALIIALARQDEDAIFNIHAQMGFKTRKDSKYVSVKAATIGFDKDDRVTTEGMNLQQYIEHLGKVDFIESGADDFIMVSRASILMRGLGYHLQYPLETAQEWRDFAEKVLKDQDTSFEEMAEAAKKAVLNTSGSHKNAKAMS